MLGLPPGFSDVLYYRQAKSKLPFKSIVEEFKSGKIRLQMMLEYSKDKITKAYIENRKEVESQDNLAFKEIIGHTRTEKQGFGTNEKQRWLKTSGKNRRDMVIQDVRSNIDNKRFLKAFF